MAIRSSGYSSIVPVTVIDETRWTFVAPNDPTIRVDSLKVLLPHTQERTEQVGIYRPLGRTKALVVSSAISGNDGTYEFVTTTSDEWDDLYAVLTYQGTIFVTDPLGRTKYVRFLTRRWRETGPIDSLQRFVTVDYVEVDEP
jgi:hypothetical protein